MNMPRLHPDMQSSRPQSERHNRKDSERSSFVVKEVKRDEREMTERDSEFERAESQIEMNNFDDSTIQLRAL